MRIHVFRSLTLGLGVVLCSNASRPLGRRSWHEQSGDVEEAKNVTRFALSV